MSKLALKNCNINEILVDYKRRDNKNGKKTKNLMAGVYY